MRKKLLVLAAVMGSLVPVCYAQQDRQVKTPPLIRGVVEDDRTGKPVEDAVIAVHMQGLGRVLYAARSDKKGEFVVPWIPDLENDMLFKSESGELTGIVMLFAAADDYENAQKEFVISRGKTGNVKIKLDQVTRVIRHTYKLRHRKPEHVLQSIAAIFGESNVVAAPELNTVIVEMKELEKARADSHFQMLDVPLRNIKLEVLVIKADARGTEGSTFPPELDVLVQQLSKTLRYRNYTLIGRASALGTERSYLQFEASTSDSSLGEFKVGAYLEYRGGYITLRDLKINFQRQGGNNIATTVNLRSGEKALLGVSQAVDENMAYIISVSAEEVR